MKYLILPVALIGMLLICGSTFAQHVLRSGEWFGLAAEDGTIILPVNYDSVYLPESPYHSSCRIYRKGPQYGIVNLFDQWQSGLVFDEVRQDRESGILLLRKGALWGFMTLQQGTGGRTPAATRYIEPQYDALWSSRTDDVRFLSVKAHGQYGLLSAYTADTLVPIRFPYGISEVGGTAGFPLFMSGFNSDNPNDSLYVYNTQSDVTIAFHERTEVSRMSRYPFVFGLNEYMADRNNNGLFEVYDFTTGQRLFHYDVIADDRFDLYSTTFEMLNDRIIKVIVKYAPKQTGQSYHYIITCVDVYTQYRHFAYEGPQFYDLEIGSEDNGESPIYRMRGYRRYPEKDIIGYQKTNGSIRWLYERFRD